MIFQLKKATVYKILVYIFMLCYKIRIFKLMLEKNAKNVINISKSCLVMGV